MEPFMYLSSIPGKEVRSHLIDAFNIWLRVPDDRLAIVRRVIQMLHNASLLWVGGQLADSSMDDVEDDSELRRGVPVAHHVYGIPQTINTANYVYFLAFQELLKLRPHGERDVDLVSMVTGGTVYAPNSR